MSKTESLILGYIIAINLLAYIIWATDKYRAKKGRRRISEKTLFTIALLGGSIGSLAAMHIVRHKTKHPSFRIGIPAILFLQLVLLFWWEQ